MDAEEHFWFTERALLGMLAIADELGDERVCARAELPDANSAYGLVTHCLGVLEYWVGHLVAGRRIERDRPAEFTATGRVAQLRAAVADGLARFRGDLASFEALAPPRFGVDAEFLGPDRDLTQN